MNSVIKVSPVWTMDLVARRAAEFVAFEKAVKSARFDYSEACDDFRKASQIEGRIDTSDPHFREATEMPYLAYLSAKRSAYNARRRLDAAVRNCPDLREIIR